MRKSVRLHGKSMRMKSRARSFQQVRMKEINISSALECFTTFLVICSLVCCFLLIFFSLILVTTGTPTLNIAAIREALRKEVSLVLCIMILKQMCCLKSFRGCKSAFGIFNFHDIAFFHAYCYHPWCSL
jgi:membrane-anchored glycerophosphoryl diester phosphodiesterase (GDPDase)